MLIFYFKIPGPIPDRCVSLLSLSIYIYIYVCVCERDVSEDLEGIDPNAFQAELRR